MAIDERGDEHVATIAGGAWTATLDATEALVCFTVADGQLVAHPLPSGERRAVADAVEACPVCAAVAWVRIDAAVACERCGHVAGQVHETGHGGISMWVSASVDPEEEIGVVAIALVPDGDGRRDGISSRTRSTKRPTTAGRQQRRRCRSPPTPPLGASRRPGAPRTGRARSCSSTSRGLTSSAATAASSPCFVSTVPIGEQRSETPRDALASMAHHDVPDQEGSAGAKLVAFAHHHRSMRREVARTEVVERALPIDGRAESFAFSRHWAALINIPDHPGMSFGDGGGLSIVIALVDLAAGRYDRLVTEPSMG